MGMIIAKFRKKKSNSELLEKIDKEIKSIEDFQRNTEQQRKRIVGQFLVGSVGLYMLSAILFYFYFYPKNFKERLLYLVPFVLAPTFIFLMKRLLTMYYNRKLSKNQDKIVELRSEKKKLLENIMETETYKVARSILEKYAPEQVRKVNLSQELTPVKTPAIQMSGSGLRNRTPGGYRPLGPSMMQTPRNFAQATVATGIPTPSIRSLSPISSQAVAKSSMGTPMPRYIPSKDRTMLDKVVDYLIGDGPNNRYALICKQCSGHNGMALMDEFEYISFKCCYCFALNPARKKRLVAPKLKFESLPAPASSDTSDSEKISGSDTEEEQEKEVRSASPPLETIYQKETENKLVGSDELAVSSDNEPNDFDKLSDLETRDADAEHKNEVAAESGDKQ